MINNYYKKLIILLYIICLITAFCGCGKKKESQQEKILKYDNKLDISTLKEHELTDEIKRLNCPNEIRTAMSVVDNLEDLKAAGNIDLIRYNNGKYYSVTKVEGEKFLFLLYDQYDGGYYVADGCLVSKLPDKALFENIKVGMNKEEIIEKDESSFISSNYSYHRLNDKSMLKIKYTKDSNQNVVSEISYLDNPISVLDYLIEDDLAKIHF